MVAIFFPGNIVCFQMIIDDHVVFSRVYNIIQYLVVIWGHHNWYHFFWIGSCLIGGAQAIQIVPQYQELMNPPLTCLSNSS